MEDSRCLIENIVHLPRRLIGTQLRARATSVAFSVETGGARLAEVGLLGGCRHRTSLRRFGQQPGDVRLHLLRLVRTVENGNRQQQFNDNNHDRRQLKLRKGARFMQTKIELRE